MEIKGQDGCYLYIKPQEEERSIEEYGGLLKQMQESSMKQEEKYLEIAKGMKVLIAEDNIACQKLIAAYLKTLGIKSISMRSGQEAIQYVKTNICDLVLVDQVLPDMEGIEVAKTIGKQTKADNYLLPVVMMVSYEMPDMNQILKESGILDYLIKPVDVKQIKRVILAYQKADQGERQPKEQEKMAEERTEV